MNCSSEALATLLASIGLYGMMAFVVARRTRESEVVILLSLIAAMAGLVPARRASRIDPLLALPYE